MRRSHSFSSLGKSETHTYDDEEEGESGSAITCESQQSYSILRWSSNKSRKPMVNFSAACVLVGTPNDCLEEIKKFHLGFKFVRTECRLVRNILNSHGFKEISPNSIQFNLMWTGTHLKPYTLRALSELQKVNHFPRSYELTRKDRLYRNIQRMQHVKGTRHFDFIPQSFVLTAELNDFYAAFLKDRGPWIVKPVASSRGRGIYLIGHPNQIPVDDNVLVCKYINNPLLINGFKFDCRLYVTVTCYDPLRLYLYEEGLARFSTVKYERSGHINNQWMHLTNYSVNKNSEDYVRCEDPEVDDYGSKWSFSAMLRHLKESGKDVEALMARIEDVIIKTIISGEMAIATACKMFVPFRSNCFELFGFDILVDENLKPWLLEVNLSPSLGCDSPLDLKIKSNLITDLFNLTGIVADDPTSKKPPKLIMEAKKKQRQSSATFTSSELKTFAMKSINKLNDGLTNEERKILRETREESKRCGGFVRLYPSPESWELYGSFQEHQTTHNRMLHAKLYPELWRTSQRPQSATYIARARNFSSINKPIFSQASEGSLSVSGQNFHQRFQIYQKKLATWSDFSLYAKSNQSGDIPQMTVSKSQLVQGQLINPSRYEEKLLLKESPDIPIAGVFKFENADIIKQGQYLNKFQARKAFALYLKRVQNRLIAEIGSSQNQPNDILSSEEVLKQEQQIDLIRKFLLKSAVNLSNPIEVAVPKKNLPLKERKKILAQQLNDFVEVYTEETNIMMEREVTSKREEANAISEESFDLFIASACESELEDLLTLFTRHNKSASIFLGAKRDKKLANFSKTEESGLRKSPVDLKEKDYLPNLKDSAIKKQESRKEVQEVTNVSESNKLDARNHMGNSSACTPNTASGGKHCQYVVNKPRSRSISLERGNKLSTICAYTGANALMKLHNHQGNGNKHSLGSMTANSRASSSTSSNYKEHVFGVDDPKLQKTLKNISLKQARRTYSSNNVPSSTADSKLLNNKMRSPTNSTKNLNVRVYNKLNVKRDDNNNHASTLENFIKYGQQFVVENKKDLHVDRINYKQQTTSTQTVETCVSKFNSENSSISNSDYVHYPNEPRNILRVDDAGKCLVADQHPTYNQPRPPDKKKPMIKKQINPRRITRFVKN